MPVNVGNDSVTITLASNPKTSVKILNYGATVLEWKVNGVEKLWLSKAAKLDGSKAVRGGIPLVFPRFGPATGNHPATDKLPQHGFARIAIWEFLGQVDEHTVQYGLGPENLTEQQRDAWPYNFTLIYTVSLEEDALKVSMSVENAGTTKPFDFNVLFHTYFAVPDVTKTHIEGLHGLTYADKVLGGKEIPSETEKTVSFSGEVDRVYKYSPSKVFIETAGKKEFEVDSSPELVDTVVWNPWEKGAAGMSDYEPKNGYEKMVCVEKGAVDKFVNLDAGKKWEASVKYKSLL